MAETLPPVLAQTPCAARQDRRTEIGQMPLRQDQKAAVVGDQLQAVILVAVVPTNPLIAHRAFPGRRRKTQQGNPFPPIVGSIPERLADLADRAEIVMGVQQLLKTPLLALPDRANPDLSQLQVPCLTRPLRPPSFHTQDQPVCPDLSTTRRRASPFTPGPIHPAIRTTGNRFGWCPARDSAAAPKAV